MTHRKTSLKDIAQKAGVSVALVSYVLNHKRTGRINKETAARILALARSMNYVPNHLAKSLKTNKTHTIGLITGSISNSFFASLARNIEDAAEAKGYTVIFGSSDEDLEKFERLTETFLNKQVDGLIIAAPPGAERQIASLKEKRIPFVLVDRYFPKVETDHVVLDNAQAARTAVEHLVAGGKKHLAFISFDNALQHYSDREEGFLEGLKKAGLSAAKNPVIKLKPPVTQEEMILTIDKILHGKNPVDGILFGANHLAILGVKYLNILPVKIPSGLAIISFDETEQLEMFYAPLTYLRQPLEMIGNSCVDILLQKMQGDESTTQVKCKATLVVNQSTVKVN